MKKLTLYALVVMFGLLIFPLENPVVAQDDGTETVEETTSDDTATDESKPKNQNGEARLERAEDAETRAQQRRAEREEAIDQARAERVASRCERAQERIQTAIDRASEVKAERSQRYANVSSILSGLQERLAAADIDTTTFLEQIGQYDTLVTNFLADFELYELALQDAAAVDCVNDTEGFILALDEARAMKSILKESAAEIRAHITGTIVATLDGIKASLNADDSASEDEEA